MFREKLKIAAKQVMQAHGATTGQSERLFEMLVTCRRAGRNKAATLKYIRDNAPAAWDIDKIIALIQAIWPIVQAIIALFL